MNIQRLSLLLALWLATSLAASASELLNVDFTYIGNPAFRTKTGPAAIGINSSDIWNSYNYTGAQNQSLLWHDGSASPVRMSGPPAGAWYTYDFDGMLGSYLYVEGAAQGGFPVEFTGIPAGTYDLYVYAHGLPAIEGGNIEVKVGGVSLGSKTTSTNGDWNLPEWTEGSQYVRFNGVALDGSQKLSVIASSSGTISVFSSVQRTPAVLNGLQLISRAITSVPPSITEQPTNQFAVAGGAFTLAARVAGTPPFTYQWFQDDHPLPGATLANLSVPIATGTNTGNYKVRIENSAGAETSVEARVRVIDPLTGDLLNIRFTEAGNPIFRASKVGPAAVGRSQTDFWNDVGSSTNEVKWSDGNGSSITASISGSSPWYTTSRDPMLHGFRFAQGTLTAKVSNLPAGAYTLRVYAHGQAPADNAAIEVLVNGASKGIKSTSSSADWNGPEWTEGGEFVTFTDFPVLVGDEITISSRASNSGIAMLNGLQLAYVPRVFAPTIVVQPLSQSLPQGQMAHFAVAASGTAPLTYQWLKNGDVLPGATSASLDVLVNAANAGNYSARISNLGGFVVTSEAVLSVSDNRRMINVDFTEVGNLTFSTKVGPAAIGLSENDYWNVYAGRAAQNVSLKWNDGTPSGSTLTGPAFTLWFAWDPDAMLESYLLGSGRVDFNSLLPGTYDLYVYAHGIDPANSSSIEAFVDSASQGIKRTSSSGDWDKPDWTENSQYVLFRNIVIGAGQKLGVSINGFINGIQLIQSNTQFPPVIVEPPLNQSVVAGGGMVLRHKAVGNGPFKYQWTKDGIDIEGATNSIYSLTNAAARDGGAYRVKLQGIYGATTSAPGVVKIIQSSPTPLLNIDFKKSGLALHRYTKTGPAAIGRSGEDFWNTYGNSTGPMNLLWSDGSASPAKLSIGAISGPWYTYSADPMLQSFIHNGSSDLVAHITGLPPGSYAFYVYAHGQPPTDNSTVILQVGSANNGSKSTSSAPDWMKAEWTENSQYVRFADVSIVAGQEAVVTSKPGVGGLAVLNGLQIVRTDGGLVITAQPASVATTDGATAHFSALAQGVGALHYQWSHNGDPIPNATSSTLDVTASAATAGNYTVRVDDNNGFVISSSAILTILQSAPHKIIDVDFTQLGNATFTTKVGAAAVGMSTDDYWNIYNYGGAQTVPLKWNDGSDSGATLVGPAFSNLWYTWSSDAMFESYLVGSGKLDFNALPEGIYDIYVYGHGETDQNTTSAQAFVGDVSYGTQATSNAVGWDVPEWTEGKHYVRFRNVPVVAGQVLSVQISGYMNGLQLAPSSITVFPPAVVEPPMNQSVVAEGTMILTQKTIGTGPFTYQWTKDGFNIPSGTNADYTITNATQMDGGDYRVQVRNSVGVTISAPGHVRIISASQGRIANVDFRKLNLPMMFRKDKVGPGAVGTASHDIWNVYSGVPSRIVLNWANGSPSPINLQVSSLAGAWYTFSDDPMLQSFMHNTSGTITASLTGLQPGSYSFYVYAHGQYAVDNANIELKVGSVSKGLKSTSFAADWMKPEWTENSQFVRFGEVSVGPNQTVQIVSSPGVNHLAMLNGIQIVFDDAPHAPKVTLQPTGKTQPEGGTVQLSAIADGSEPMRYQWSKDGIPVSGAISNVLTLAPLSLTNAGTYTVRVENDFGFTVSSNAVVIVTVDHEPPVVKISSPAPGPQDSDTFLLKGIVLDTNAVTVRWQLNGKDQGPLAVADNIFLVQSAHMAAGSNRVKVLATDVSGNVGVDEVLVSWIPPRSLSLVGSPSAPEGSRITIPLMLISTGGVGGLSFTASFDTNALADAQLDWGTGSKVTNGYTSYSLEQNKLFRAVFALAGDELPAGSVQIATLSFRLRSVPSDTVTPITLALTDISTPMGRQFTSNNFVYSTSVTIKRRRVSGDNNGNDRLDTGDATVMLRMISRIEIPRSWDTVANDLNLSGTLDTGDAITALRAAAGIDPQPLISRSYAPLLAPTRTESVSLGGMELAPSRTIVAPGDTVAVDVRLAGQTAPVSGAAFRVDYPESALRLDGYSLGSSVPMKALALWNSQPGSITLAVADAAAWANNNGILARLKFTALAPGATIALLNCELTDGYEDKLLDASTITLDGPPSQFSSNVTFGAGGVAHLTLTGLPGVSYKVEASSDLIHWDMVGAYSSATGTIQIDDSAGAGETVRFYKATQQ